MTAPVRITGTLTRVDKERSPYYYVPFHVPEGVRCLTLSFDYTDRTTSDDLSGLGNIIDVGLFDARGIEWMTPGFRGGGGSARSVVTIGEESATPGYWPGNLVGGEWSLMLGLYSLTERPCEYELTVAFDEEPRDFKQVTLPGPAEFEPINRSPGWYRGDLQSHSFHSDASGSLDALVDSARRRGLDFLAVTDHNSTSGWPYLPHLDGDGLLLIPGEEVTTYYGHMNVWNARSWLDFRCPQLGSITQVIEAAHGQGAVCSVNHPKIWGPDWLYPDDVPVDCWEVWNGPWLGMNVQALSRWDALLRAGRRIVAVGGSDFHQPAPDRATDDQPGFPTTWVYAEELSIQGILRGILSGRVCVTEDVDGPRIDVGARSESGSAVMGGAVRVRGESVSLRCEVLGGSDSVLRLKNQDGVLARIPIGEDEQFVWEGELPVHAPGYVRAELLRAPGTAPATQMRAISNPIYLERG